MTVVGLKPGYVVARRGDREFRLGEGSGRFFVESRAAGGRWLPHPGAPVCSSPKDAVGEWADRYIESPEGWVACHPLVAKVLDIARGMSRQYSPPPRGGARKMVMEARASRPYKAPPPRPRAAPVVSKQLDP